MKNQMKAAAFAAFGLVAVSCSHDMPDYEAQFNEEYSKNFETMVLGNESIDPNQTWNTSVNTKVKVSVNLDEGETYKVYIFIGNPALNSDARYIGVTSVASGSTASLNVARPSDVNTFFLAVVDKNGRYSVERVEAEGEELQFNIGGSGAAQSRARRVTAEVGPEWGTKVTYTTDADTYRKPGTWFINDMKNYTTWDGYYDLTTVDAQYYEKLCVGRNNEFGTGTMQPIYGDGNHFIVPAGKSLTVDKLNWNDGGGNDHIIVVAGTLTINGSCKFDNGKSIVVAGGGKLILNGEKLEVTNTSRLMNYGTLEINGTYIDFTNGNEKGFYNSGTITGKNGAVMDFAGSYGSTTPMYYNAGRIDLGDGAFQFNGTATLINDGHIKAASGKKGATTFTDLSASAQNGTVVNMCDMSIDFYGVNTYIGCDNSLLYCKTGLFCNAGNTLLLGSQAMVSVGDWYDNGGTIRASDNADEYAVFKWTGTITEQSSQPFGAYGQVYFAGPKLADKPNTYANDVERRVAAILGYQYEHHYQGVKQPMQHFADEATTDKIIVKDEDGCNYLGFGDDGGHGGGFEPNWIYYAFEDLGSTKDFDFNDVVIRVSTPDENGNSKVELCATGGELKAYVLYNNAKFSNQEVHQLLGVATNWKEGNTYGKTKDFVEIGTLQNITADTDLTTLPFGIEVEKNDGTSKRVTAAVGESDKTPLFVVVNGDEEGKWFWPYELVNIAVAYPEFGAWGADMQENTDWYKHPATLINQETVDGTKVVVW